VRDTIAALDSLLARFDRPGADGRRPDARPFDITEYTEAMRVLGASAQQLQLLLTQTEGKLPAVDAATAQTTAHLTALVDHMYWRLVQLIVILVVATVLGALGYRALVRRG
jgi:hypothetical protein